MRSRGLEPLYNSSISPADNHGLQIILLEGDFNTSRVYLALAARAHYVASALVKKGPAFVDALFL